MKIWKRFYKYPGLGFWENFFGGHADIGPVTVYGENAMHWAVTVRVKGRGFLCFRLPFRCFGGWRPLYCYFSPDGTPTNASRWFWGRKARDY